MRLRTASFRLVSLVSLVALAHSAADPCGSLASTPAVNTTAVSPQTLPGAFARPSTTSTTSTTSTSTSSTTTTTTTQPPTSSSSSSTTTTGHRPTTTIT